MGFKGTQGPWVISELGEPSRNNGNTGCHTIATAKNIKDVGFIEVWFSDDFTVTTKEEAHANALLISKAPEMLDMLQSILASEHLKGTIEESKVKQLINSATQIN